MGSAENNLLHQLQSVWFALELWIQPCFSLILSASVWVSYSPSLRFRCYVRLSADSSGALFPLSCAFVGGFSGDPAFTSLSHSMLYKGALFVLTQKCLSFLLFAVVFSSDVFSSLVPSPFLSFFLLFFYSPPRGSVVFQSDCGPFPSASDSTAWGFCLPLWQWLPRTEAAGSDVW